MRGKSLGIVLIAVLFVGNSFGVKNFVLISAPGSGKGTFSQYMVKKYGHEQICPGDIFRNEIALGTQLGKQIQPIVDRGDYVDENIVCTLIAQYVIRALDNNKSFIIDGFPRSPISFNFLHSLLKKYGIEKDVCFLQFCASDETCAQRIETRQVCMNCFRVYNTATTERSTTADICDDCGAVLSGRKADTASIAHKRLEYFHTHIEPLMDEAEKFYPTKKINSECLVDELKGHYEQLYS